MYLPGIGEVTGYIVGYRCWREHSFFTLRSLGVNYYLWPKGRAANGNVDASTGMFWWRKGHGIYAFKELPEYCRPHFIWGRVALWGKVVEHETGYRAEYAYPIELYQRGWNRVTPYAREYQCEIGPPLPLPFQ